MNPPSRPQQTPGDIGDDPLSNRAGCLVIIFGFVGTLLAQVLTFVVLSSMAPRTDEGIRRVITWPFQPYATAAHLIPVMLVYVVGLMCSRRRIVRLILVGSSALTVLVWFLLNDAFLLRRDYLGKF